MTTVSRETSRWSVISVDYPRIIKVFPLSVLRPIAAQNCLWNIQESYKRIYSLSWYLSLHRNICELSENNPSVSIVSRETYRCSEISVNYPRTIELFLIVAQSCEWSKNPPSISTVSRETYRCSELSVNNPRIIQVFSLFLRPYPCSELSWNYPRFIQLFSLSL